MHQHTLRRTAALLGLTLGLFATGCGVSASNESVGSGPGTSAGTTATGGVRFLSAAVAKTGEVTTEKASITMELGGVGKQDRSASVTTEGTFDLASGQAEVTFDLGGGGASGSVLGDSPATIILDGSTVYASGSVFDMLTEDGKPWIKIDGTAGGVTKGFTDGLATDPQAYVEMLRGAGDEFVEVGKEDVRGVATTHTTTTIDLTQLADDASPKDQARIDDALAKLGADADVITKVPADVWIDGDGYVRRLRLAPDVDEVAGKDLTSAITIELYDFNVPVDITIPPADQISELDGLLGGN